ncbi:MAG: hypothetical protein M3092_09355 [Actinomycetia bacterium]|nr:hypothetical protein [Actinomycetes bacterium]
MRPRTLRIQIPESSVALEVWGMASLSVSTTDRIRASLDDFQGSVHAADVGLLRELIGS